MMRGFRSSPQPRWVGGAVGLVLAAAYGCMPQADATRSGESGASRQRKLIDRDLERKLRAYHEDISEWIMTLDVGSGFRKLQKGSKYSRSSTCLNSYLARTLMASYRMTGNKAHLDEALRWCDFMCKNQHKVATSTGEEGGFWPDHTLDGNLYLADASCTGTALAVAYRLADDKRKAVYLDAMERFARFVTRGCLTDPQGLGRKVTKSWVIAEGANQGALGVGYYGKKPKPLNVKPYTVSTVSCGVMFFSELYATTSNPEYRDVAVGAIEWLLKSRNEDGQIPYVINGKVQKNKYAFCMHNYSGEAFEAADRCLKDPGIRSLFRKELKSTVEWLLARQHPDGFWGTHGTLDGFRTPLCMVFLNWYYNNINPDPKVAESVRKYCRFLVDPANSRAHYVKRNALLTGFVGEAVAEVMSPGSAF